MARAKWAVLAVVGLLALAGAGAIAASGGLFSRGGVEQPIPFPHDVHAGANEIPCMYCHYSADRSPDAGIPPVEVCAGCHAPGGVPMVATDRPGVQQLLEYWQNQEPIPWARVYKLPDYVQFPHMMHVNAEIECQQCHGAVETMTEVTQEASLQMGWCIDCHVEREARIDCFICHY